MGFPGERIRFLIMVTLVLTPQMRNLDETSSFLSFSAIVVAFDVALLSNALNSFVTKGGGKDSFDLVICIPHSQFADDALRDVVLKNALDFRIRLSNCSDIAPPSKSDYTQILYMILPEDKAGVGETIKRISKVYHIIKKTFLSTRVAKLLWMPLFLVIWPEYEDYCQNETTTKRLLQSHSPPPVINNNFDGNEDINVYKSFSVNTDLYIYFGSECEDLEDNVLEIYSLGTEGITNVQKLSPDNRKYESMFEGLLGRVRRRINLQNTTVIAVNSKDPSSFLEGPKSGLLNPLEITNGTPRVVFSELREFLNFSVEIIKGDWISRFPNGTLKGVTANLFRRGMADVTISLTSLLPYRKVELSFLQPTYGNSVNGFFVQPAASTLRDIVIKPFSFGLWISLFVTYLILIVSVLCFVRIYGKMYEMHCESLPENDFIFHDELLLWAVAAITQQGWHSSPTSNSIRFAFTIGYYLGLVCFGAFSAAITAILAVELVPIKTRSDLLSSDLKFYADDASSTMAYVVDHLREHTSVQFGSRVNIREGVARLKSKEPSCYLAFPQYFYLSAVNINLTESWICSHLSVIPVTTVDTPSSMVVPRNSAYAELFNFIILKMKTRGLNHRFVNLYNEVTQSKCSKSASSKFFHPLGVKDVFTAGLILLGGMILGTTLLLFERALQLFNCIRRRYRTRTANRSNNIFFES